MYKLAQILVISALGVLSLGSAALTLLALYILLTVGFMWSVLILSILFFFMSLMTGSWIKDDVKEWKEEDNEQA